MDPAAERLAPLLAQLVNYERTRPDRRLWDLGTMRRLLARPDAPPPPRPAIQVGGSKGKGTTSAMLEALATAAGLTAGFYSSPHLVTLLERMRCGNEQITVGELEDRLRRLLAVPGGDRPPTFFEAMTLAAAEWFAAQRVALAIYEVGLGGRYDATTALPVDASIVTTIELEHTDVLGSTVAAIASEKAPVIREGGVGFTGTEGEALAVVRAHAQANGARLFVLGEHFGVRDVRWHPAGLRGQLRLPDGRERAFFLPDARAFEVPALALAAAAFVHVLPDAGLALDPAPRPQLACRFEVREEPDGEALVLDGAHTEQSLAAVATELRRRFAGRRARVLYGSATGKRWREGLSALLPVADRFVVTELSGIPCEDPHAIAAFLEAAGARSEVAADPASGLAALRAGPGPRLVVGSFYLAGQVRQIVLAEATRRTPR
ncbi:MAG TPA: hypothetical protein VFZ65_07335 [Planctomycetota bacterium]|nr:hypothetical protein [Planctomycetota bacterium]